MPHLLPEPARIGNIAAARLGALSFDQRMAAGLFALMALLPVAISVLGGGYLLSLGMHPPQIFLSACGFALIAAIATALLVFRGRRTEVLTVQEAAQ